MATLDSHSALTMQLYLGSSKITIGTENGANRIKFQSDNESAIDVLDGTLEIYGGTFSGSSQIYAEKPAVQLKGGSLVIHGGTFETGVTANAGSLTITGGEFCSVQGSYGLNSNCRGSISGGVFHKIYSTIPPVELLADGYAFSAAENDASKIIRAGETCKSGDGYAIDGTVYVVEHKTHTYDETTGECACGKSCPHEAVDADGNCTYCKRLARAVKITKANGDYEFSNSFAEAIGIGASNTGSTVKLLKDASVSERISIGPECDFTIDLNGKTLTGAVDCIFWLSVNYYQQSVTLINSADTQAVVQLKDRVINLANLSSFTIGNTGGASSNIQFNMPGRLFETNGSEKVDIVINGGTFTTTSSTLSANQGRLKINGGVFQTTAEGGYGLNTNRSGSLSGGTYYGLTTGKGGIIADLLADGYGFQKADGSWLTAEELAVQSTQETLTVAAAPITSLKVKLNGAEVNDTYQVKVGTGLQFTAETAPTDAVVTWTVDGAESSTGSFTPTAAGTYTVKCTATKDDYTAVKTVTVSATQTTPQLEGSLTLSNDGTITYGQPLSTISISGTMKDGETTVAGTFKWTNETETPDASDSYEAAWTFTPVSSEYAVVTGKAAIKVNKAAPAYTQPAVKTGLVYNTAAQELVTAGTATGGTMQYSTDGTNYSTSIPAGTDAKAYTVWYKVVGDKNHNDSQPHSLTVTIAPMQLSAVPYDGTAVLTSSDVGREYDGTREVPVTIQGFVKYGGDAANASDRIALEQDKDYKITRKEFDSAEVGNDHTATLEFEILSKNYTFVGDAKYVLTGCSITKAYSANLQKQNGSLTVVRGARASYTYGLSQLLPTLPAGQTYGTVSYAASWNGSNDVCKSINVENGVLTAQIDTTQGVNDNAGSITVTVRSTNYDAFTLTINVTAVDQKLPQGEPILSKTTLTYGDKLSSITLSGAMKDGENTVEGTFAWTQPDAAPAAGTYMANWKFTPAESGKYMEVTGTAAITVNKATPTGAPKYTAINTSGKALADAALTTEGGTFSVEGKVKWVDEDGKELPADTEVTANTAYKWVFTPNDTANYNTLEGTVTLWRRSSSGGGGGSSSGTTTKTETTTNPDGSVTKTETKSDGTVIETTTGKDGSTTKTETKPDGSSKTEVRDANGSTGTVSTDKNGQTTAEAKVSDKAVSDAKKSGEAVKVPTEVTPGEDSKSAPTVKIDLPSGAGETKIEIPVKDVNSGTVAIIVKPDGTEEIVKDSIPTEDGIQLTVDGDVTVKIVDNAKDFTDTKGHWAQDSIDFVSARGLVSGTSATTFSPDAPTTRAQLWTILARQAGADLTGGANWYEKAQNWAKANGISDGTNPNGTITRAQMVTMLWRAAGSPEVSVANTFTDVPADSYYAKAVAWAVEHGITTGVGNGKFDPSSTCTRAQIATFLHRSYLSK